MTIDKTFLDALESGHNEVAKEMFKASLADKTFTALDALRGEIAASFMPADNTPAGSETPLSVGTPEALDVPTEENPPAA